MSSWTVVLIVTASLAGLGWVVVAVRLVLGRNRHPRHRKDGP